MARKIIAKTKKARHKGLEGAAPGTSASLRFNDYLSRMLEGRQSYPVKVFADGNYQGVLSPGQFMRTDPARTIDELPLAQNSRDLILDTNIEVDKWNKQYVQSSNYLDMLNRAGLSEKDISARKEGVLNFNPNTDITFNENNPSLGVMYHSGSFLSSGTPRPISIPGKDQINYNSTLMPDHPAYNTPGMTEAGWEGVSAHEQGHLLGGERLNRKTRKALKDIAKDNKQYLKEFSVKSKESYRHAKDPEEMRANLLQLRYQMEREGIYKSTEGDINTKPFTMEHLKKIVNFDKDGRFKGFKPKFNSELLQTISPSDIIWMMNNIASGREEMPKGTMRVKYGGPIPKVQDGGGSLPKFQDINSETELEEEIIQGGMLPEVEVSALTDESYNKLSEPQKQVYDTFVTPQGIAQTVDLGDDRSMHYKSALQMTEDLGIRNISNKPSFIFNKLFNRKKENEDFTAHVNPILKNVNIPAHSVYRDRLTFGNDIIKKLQDNEGYWAQSMTEQERADQIRRFQDAQTNASRKKYFENLIAEYAHIPEFWRKETFINKPKSFMNDAMRFITGKETDHSRYHDKDHYEYKTHNAPDSFEEQLREKYKMQDGGSLPKVQDGFKNQFNTNYQESQNYQRIKGSRKGVRKNPDGSHSTHLMADNNKDEAWTTLFQDKDGNWFEPINAYEEAKRRGEIYKFDSKEELINFARKGDWKDTYQDGGFVNKYQKGGIPKAQNSYIPGIIDPSTAYKIYNTIRHPRKAIENFIKEASNSAGAGREAERTYAESNENAYGTTGGTRDAMRHAYATGKNVRDYGIRGLVLPMAHEFEAVWNKNKRNAYIKDHKEGKSYTKIVKEAGQDMWNNLVGAYIGVTSDTEEEMYGRIIENIDDSTLSYNNKEYIEKNIKPFKRLGGKVSLQEGQWFKKKNGGWL